MIIALILVAALGILGWGFYRAKPYGKLGLLSWLQSVVLMLPWLTFFGLVALGIYINLAIVIFLLVGSIGLYILLGRQLRTIAGNENFTKRFSSVNATNTKAEIDQSEPAAADASPQSPSETPAPTPASSSPSASTEPAKLSPSLPAEDLQAIQGIFGIDTFFATETIPYQDGVIFRGNLRGEPDSSYDRLAANLKTQVGDRYRLFLVEGMEGRPVVVVLPSANQPQPTTPAQLVLAIVLGLATIATCLETAGLLLGFDFFSEMSRYAEVLPIASGILAVLGAHEIAHRVVARRYQIRLSPPFFIPTGQIGSFGALMRFESVLPNRSVLFDIAFAGPAIGGLVALGLLIIGLLLSHPGSLFQIPAEFLQGSILVGTLARVVLGAAVQQPLVDVHPLVLIGWLGLVITALNLMPAGQLDGGRIVQSIYGRKVAGRTTVATLIVLGLASLVNPLALYWAILILFLQRDLERPALNELSEPNDARAALGLLVLFLMAATLLPLTPSLAGRLGIGG
ncbi:site-2 protease family protein [Thermocoleostomius sinensis]|uniref:Site-2 protease family protein n=1 Tax=Thermocoleostomius sinensis A174 TaxID=2016057 RepID=A0A9E8Z9Y2_9CYAN|nr:site-2 protease family protein [Thermocoleostomius sinensis]WAL59016.1 site-2 protease family protein [Thermocoleostomius sinensis A174]